MNLHGRILFAILDFVITKLYLCLGKADFRAIFPIWSLVLRVVVKSIRAGRLLLPVERTAAICRVFSRQQWRIEVWMSGAVDWSSDIFLVATVLCSARSMKINQAYSWKQSLFIDSHHRFGSLQTQQQEYVDNLSICSKLSPAVDVGIFVNTLPSRFLSWFWLSRLG